MPFKSESQRRKFYQLHKEGKISKDELDEWVRKTGDKKLPNRVSKKKRK